MSKPKRFEKPMGFKDILPEVVVRKRYIEGQVQQLMRLWGYQEIVTPILEYYDTVGRVSTTLDDKLFKLLDRNGNTVVLRPDMTAPIARVVASLLKEEPFPLRLSYHSNVFRAQAEEAGRDSEFYQTGVELVGEGSTEGDAEVIALAVAALQTAGVERFKVAIGHMGFIQGFLEECVPVEEQRLELKERLLARDFVGLREGIRRFDIGEEQRSKLNALLQLRGQRECCSNAQKLTAHPGARAALEQLHQIWDSLEAYDVADSVLLDLTMIGNFDYYTGMIFEAYASDHGFPVCSGGRYDTLLGQFGRPAPATGFGLKMDRVLEVSNLSPPNHQTKVLIQYDESRRADAMKEARRRRQIGEIVVTQLVSGNQADREDLAQRFTETILLDQAGGELHD
jgi:ATP phosphoribosyltransferase regulatory subunit